MGVPSDPATILLRALRAGHPRSMEIYLKDAVDEAIRDKLIREPHLLAKKRAVFFKAWHQRAMELELREGLLRENLPTPFWCGLSFWISSITRTKNSFTI